MTCVSCHGGNDVSQFFRHRDRQHVCHALVLVVHLGPDLQSGNLPRLIKSFLVVVVDCVSKDMSDVTVSQNSVEFILRWRVHLPRRLKNRVMQKPR